MCLDCGSMWDPAESQLSPPPVIEPFGMAPVDEVYGELARLAAADAPDSDNIADVSAWLHASGNHDTYEERIESMVGGSATLDGGQVAEVVSFTSSETVIVRTVSGDLAEVPIGDVLRIMPPVVIPEPVAVPDTIDAAPPDMLLALTLAQTIIRAGCESVHGSGEHVTPGVPPVGYLPAEPELHAVVERSAGLAVGMLIEMFELDVDAILEWVGAVSESDDSGNPTTEVASEQLTSEMD